MSILVDLQPHSKAGLKLSKTLMKAAVRSKTTTAVVAYAALELLSSVCDQTGTSLSAFLHDISQEFKAIDEARLRESAALRASQKPEST